MAAAIPIEIIGRQTTDANATRFSILIEGYDEPFQFTLPWHRAAPFEVAIYRTYPNLQDDWSYSLGT
jgi:hypothetical protein